MLEDSMLYLETAPFFENKSNRFCEAFVIIFGNQIRDEQDVLSASYDFSNIMWERVAEGVQKKKALRKNDIIRIRGGTVLIPDEGVSMHHWPPRSRGGQDTIKMPNEFHRAWHDVFMNLYKYKEFEIFWDKMFYLEEPLLRDVIDRTRKEAMWFDFKKKKK